MKINEVIVEAGFLSRLGQGIKAGVAGYQQSQALRQNTQELTGASKDAMTRWYQFLANYNASGKTLTPDVAYNWLNSYLRAKPMSKPGNVRPETIQTWLTQELGNYFASQKLAKQPTAVKTTTTTAPQGEAQNPTDLVNRLFKLHPDWAPEVAQQILKRSQVTTPPK